MKITIYELIGLMKDGKAPKKIKVDRKIYYLCERDGATSCYSRSIGNSGNKSFLDLGYYIEHNKLDYKIEILEEYEKNDEWEDIEIIKHEYIYGLSEKEEKIDDRVSKQEEKINQLIKNQKYLKERLDKNDI